MFLTTKQIMLILICKSLNPNVLQTNDHSVKQFSLLTKTKSDHLKSLGTTILLEKIGKIFDFIIAVFFFKFLCIEFSASY